MWRPSLVAAEDCNGITRWALELGEIDGWAVLRGRPRSSHVSRRVVTSPVVIVNVGEIEADDVDRAIRTRGVGEEADAFAGADGAESFGDDLGVAEGVGLAGFLVADYVGAEAALRAAAGGVTVADAAEPLPPRAVSSLAGPSSPGAL